MLLDECVEGKSGHICKDSFVCLNLEIVSKGNEGMVNPGGKWGKRNNTRVSSHGI